MKAAVRASMDKSMNYIRRYKDVIMRAVDASDLLPCEGEGYELAQHLDISCGIDYILVTKGGDLSRGVGCRIQEDKNFNRRYETFTIRGERDSGAKTEFEKRKLAIASGGLYPYLTMHAYIDEETGGIDRMAFARTDEIIKYCESGQATWIHTRPEQVGQASFWAIDWDKYKRDGNAIAIYKADVDGSLKRVWPPKR